MKKTVLAVSAALFLVTSCGDAEPTIESTTDAIMELTDEQIEEVSTIEAENEILEENLNAIEAENAELEELLNEL